ncbi:hypothetical protein QQP08_012747 [Theobroma cacao]|nr:hypothetical protein QQP08_012747 [Theobroma cacao]
MVVAMDMEVTMKKVIKVVAVRVDIATMKDMAMVDTKVDTVRVDMVMVDLVILEVVAPLRAIVDLRIRV